MSQAPAESSSIKTLATRHPFVFALLFFIVNILLSLVVLRAIRLPIQIGGIVYFILGSLLALSVLAWLGWLQAAGFNGPSNWRRLALLWLPALITLFYLAPLLSVHSSSTALVAYAALYALLTGLCEEAQMRGVILQVLLPYGSLAAAALSALFFGLGHLNNLFLFNPAVVIPQVAGATLLGFGFAAIRLRVNTIWPLIVLHMLDDLAVDISLFASPGAVASSSLPSPLVLAIVLIGPGLLLAAYGLYLLRHHRKGSEPLGTLRPA